jgi:hemoglobin
MCETRTVMRALYAGWWGASRGTETRIASRRRGDHILCMIETAIPPKFPITRDEIARVVAVFYASVRQHPGLGPIFAVHVEDWPAHEERVVRFWANAILGERDYDGSPMVAHTNAGNVRPGMFDSWLRLFDLTLRLELMPEQAAAWSALAHRIGRSLRAGVTERHHGPGGIPNLR